MPSARTKQQAIAERISARIGTGRWREGERLPSEQELARDHHVSLGTLQKALATLAQRGVITREHGRGTFVASRHLQPADVRFLQFRDARGVALPLYVHVLKATAIRSAGPWSRFLGQRTCVRIDRLFEAGPRVRLASEFYLRFEDFAALDKSIPRSKGGSTAARGARLAVGADNLRQLLEQRLCLPTIRVEQLIRVAPPPPRSARLLGLDSALPGFAMELFGHTVQDRALYYQRVYGGPFSDSLVIVRDGANGHLPAMPHAGAAAGGRTSGSEQERGFNG